MLLHYATLAPSGPSKLASIRFSSQVKIKKILIIPKGTVPFAQEPDIIASTEPDAFYATVYLHAQSPQADKKKAKTNALLPTILAYPGGLTEFPVDAGSEHTTRLMIVSGEFRKLSLAIYGEIINESPAIPISHIKAEEILTLSHSAARNLDPAQWTDPLSLAQSLLEMSNERTPLALITQLMFCLKPSAEDWNEPTFPHLYADISDRSHPIDLEDAIEITSRPIASDADLSDIEVFAMQMVSAIELANRNKQHSISKLLAQVAAQHPLLGQIMITNSKLLQYFSFTDIDSTVLENLLDACANHTLSLGFLEEGIIDLLKLPMDRHLLDDSSAKIAQRICERVSGWETLRSTQPDCSPFIKLIKDVALTENSFGIWLTNISALLAPFDHLAHVDLTRQEISNIWKTNSAPSVEKLIAFTKCFVAISSIVVVYTWADSVPINICRERSLAILRLWQSMPGYDEVVNHLLLLRQMTFRLECMLPLEDDLPSQAAIDAEHMLTVLTQEPNSMLRKEFMQVMRSLKQPFMYIVSHQADAFRGAADIVDEGLSSAIAVLETEAESLGANQIFLFRIALAILEKETENHQDPETFLLSGNRFQGLTNILVDRFIRVSVELQAYFAISPPLPSCLSSLNDLIKLSDELLRALSRFLPCPITRRKLTSLIKALADCFVQMNMAETKFSRIVNASEVFTSAKQACLACINILINSQSSMTDSRNSTAAILKVILDNATHPRQYDAPHHILQHLWLFDQILPASGQDYSHVRLSWAAEILPEILEELCALLDLLEAEHRVYLFKRLVALDNEITGIGEWILVASLENIIESITFNGLHYRDAAFDNVMIQRAEIQFQVLVGLLAPTSDCLTWCLSTLQTAMVHAKLSRIFQLLLEANRIYFELIPVLLLLSRHCENLPTHFLILLFRALLLASRTKNAECFIAASNVLNYIPELDIVDESVKCQIGSALQMAGNMIQEGQVSPSELAGPLELFLLKLSSAAPVDLPCLDLQIYEIILKHLHVDQSGNLYIACENLRLTGGQLAVPELIVSAQELEVPLYKWEELLSSPAPLPSTPRMDASTKMEVFGLVTISPPTALLRSPEVKGLTKTYSNNDFRQLRQTTASRQNTSRLPSMHVDEFEFDTSTASASF